jgi:hypothetical protein
LSVEFSPGSLVRARGRDWIVLPDRHVSLLRLRPITTPALNPRSRSKLEQSVKANTSNRRSIQDTRSLAVLERTREIGILAAIGWSTIKHYGRLRLHLIGVKAS